MNNFFLWPTTPGETENVILTAIKKTGPGFDQMSGKVVKEFRSIIAKPVSYLIN